MRCVLLLCVFLSACAATSAHDPSRGPKTVGECLQQRGAFPGGFATEGLGGVHMDFYSVMSCEAEVDRNRHHVNKAVKREM